MTSAFGIAASISFRRRSGMGRLAWRWKIAVERTRDVVSDTATTTTKASSARRFWVFSGGWCSGGVLTF